MNFLQRSFWLCYAKLAHRFFKYLSFSDVAYWTLRDSDKNFDFGVQDWSSDFLPTAKVVVGNMGREIGEVSKVIEVDSYFIMVFKFSSKENRILSDEMKHRKFENEERANPIGCERAYPSRIRFKRKRD